MSIQQTVLTEQKMNLEKNENMPRFVSWLYGTIKPWLGQTVLEAGAGIGTYSWQALKDNKAVVVAELSDNYIKILKKRFEGEKNTQIIQANVEKEAFVTQAKKFSPDTIVSINVLEHVENDLKTLQNFYQILPKGGRIIILVPAHPKLFNRIDTAVGHYRRYTKKDLQGKAEKAGFKINRLFFFNGLAILGWYLNGQVFKNDEISPGAIRLYNMIVPINAFIERFILQRTVGISLILIAEKK